MMKNLLLSTALLGFVFFSCSKPNDEDRNLINPNSKSVSTSIDLAQAAVNISFSKITTNITPRKNSTYNVGMDYEASTVINIHGKGFGTKPGTVKFTNYPDEYVTLGIKYWSDTYVQVSGSARLIASPRKNAYIYFADAKGNGQSQLFPSVVPFIYGREYGTTTHYSSMRRGQKGLIMQYRGQEYTNLTGLVNSNYKPAANDLWVWTTAPQHQAYVESVIERIQGSDKYYDVKLGELNEANGKIYTPTITILIRNGKIIEPYRSTVKNIPPTHYFRK